MPRLISANFKEGSNVVYTKKQYQHDRGNVLRISGVALPEKYQVHFSNETMNGVASALWVSGSDIKIPDAYFETGEYIHVWLYFAADGKRLTGTSEYEVIIPIERRPAILEVDSDGGGLVINAYLDEDDHTLVFQ